MSKSALEKPWAADKVERRPVSAGLKVCFVLK